MFATVLALMLLASSAAMPLSDRRVKVDLYIETLCPFCSGFMHNDVKDLLQSGLLEWADVTVVPSGNAHLHSDSTITCQHGVQECYWNRVLACVIHAAADQTTVLEYATCSEADFPLNIAKQAKPCMDDLGISFDDMEACANGELGAKLELAALKRTAALQPPHKYVPWIVVNDVPLRRDYTSLGSYICEALSDPKCAP